MTPFKDGKLVVLFLFVFLWNPLKSGAVSETLTGIPPATGLIELAEYRYPVYLFVPDNYQPGREYALIFSIPDEGESPRENIENWIKVAKNKSMFVLVPTVLWPNDVPYQMDEWVLGVKEDVIQRYRVSREKIYLIGERGGGDYASYLGINYAGEFSAIALIGAAWGGKTEKIIRPENRAANQRPFFIALSEKEPLRILEIEKKAARFESKGYLIYLTKVPSEADYDSNQFRARVLDWLQENAAVWRRNIQKQDESKMEKIHRWVEGFFRL